MASRKEAKEAARQRRLAEEQARAAQSQRRRRMELLGGVVVIAVAIVVVLIAVSSGSSTKAAGPPKTAKAKTALISTVDTLLTGIPQTGTTLGDPKAPVTVTYWGDLECPVCAAFTTGEEGGGFGQMVTNLVRTGKVKVDYRSFCTATCNDESESVFNTQQTAAYAARLQNKFWNYAELFYHEQGSEGSGYVTSSFLNSLAAQVPGLDYASWTTGRKNPNVVSQVSSDEQESSTLGLTGTPTVILEGPKGKAQAPEGVVTYSQIESAYKQVA